MYGKITLFEWKTMQKKTSCKDRDNGMHYYSLEQLRIDEREPVLSLMSYFHCLSLDYIFFPYAQNFAIEAWFSGKVRMKPMLRPLAAL